MLSIKKLNKFILLTWVAISLLVPYPFLVHADTPIHHHESAVVYDPAISQLNLSDKEWKKLLPPDVYKIMRQKGTERAFTGKYDKFYEPGIYICAACGNPLFSHDAKFDSKTGWPSFYQPLTDKSIEEKPDSSFIFLTRTEVICARCGGHLGHVFEDGPEPTGLRYCINSLALTFKPSSP